MAFNTLFAPPPILPSYDEPPFGLPREESSSTAQQTPISASSSLADTRSAIRSRQQSISKARRNANRTYTPSSSARAIDRRTSRDGSYYNSDLTTTPEAMQTTPEAMQATPSNSSEQQHSCSPAAQRLLERAHSSPRARAHANELFRFLGDFKRVVQSLEGLIKCPQCCTTSHFVTLLSLIVEKITIGLQQVCEILSDRSIDTNTTTFMDYGVDSAADFVSMYNGVALPPLQRLREIVTSLSAKSNDKRWMVPCENLQVADQKLINVELGMNQLR
jgi:hypothetical protein